MSKIPVRIDYDEISSWVNEVKPRRVLIQAPLGFKHLVSNVSKFLESLGVESVISASNCWGGCDVAVEEAKAVRADGIVHLGHASFIKISELPVIYVEGRYADPEPLVNVLRTISSELRKFRKIGLGMTVQWLDHLELAKSIIEEVGVEVEVGEPMAHLVHAGQILGCDYSTLKRVEERVEAFLVIGSVFHGLGIALISPKPTLVADPHTGNFKWLTETVNKIYAQRYANIVKFKEAKSVGVIVSTKPGQLLMGLAKKLVELLRAKGYCADLLVINELSDDVLVNNGFDSYVNTACPRLSIEDQVRFSKPLLLPSEVLVALNELEWSEVIEKGLLLSMSLPARGVEVGEEVSTTGR